MFMPYYALWHYGQGLRELVSNILSILNFILRFFSIPTLLSTLFSPWQRMDEGYKKGIEIEAWAETFVSNFLMRVVGFFVRSITIVIGLFTLLVVLVLCVAVFLVYVLMPLILIGLLSLAFKTLI